MSRAINLGNRRRRVRVTSVLAGVATVGLVLTGCGGAGAEGDGAAVESVPYGASVEEFQAALADMDPVTLVYQLPVGPNNEWSTRAEEFKEKVEEYSGDNITIELVFSDGIASAEQGADDALRDGRIDINNLAPYVMAQEFPLAGELQSEVSSLKGSEIVTSTLADFGATNEALWHTPEYVEEFEGHDLNLTMPAPWSHNVVVACTSPVTSLDDLAGKQIRTANLVNSGQIEALGATPVTVEYADVYESLQRGLVDCSMAGASAIISAGGVLEVAPYVIAPDGASFGSSGGSKVTGASWHDLPLAAQQLIFDSLAEMDIAGVENEVTSVMADLFEQATANGGGFYSFDSDVADALQDYNDDLVAGWADSTLIDGTAFLDRFETAQAEWATLVEDAGYPASGTLSDFEEWYDPDLDFTAYEDLFAENVIVPNRPS